MLTEPLTSQNREVGRENSRNTIGPTNDFIPFTRPEIEQPLTTRFSSQVGRSPNSLAINDGRVAWSYGELDKQANGIANTIISQLGPGEGRVALLFEQSAAMVAGMLGVLKAGKTYVPLDPLHPKQRLQFILQDADIGGIVCSDTCLSLAKVCADEVLPVIGTGQISPATAAPTIVRNPDTETYVLYTSGSTGQPKGVLQCDRNVLHFISAYTNALHLNAGDRLSLFPSYGFDASVMDIYGALLNGASLYVRDLRGLGMDRLDGWLQEHEITVWHSTPTVFRVSTSGWTHRAPSSVRLVVLGGEEAVPEDVALLGKHFDSDCLLVNGFGPTESTVTLQYFANAKSKVSGVRLPIGFPVEATHVILLDEHGKATDQVGEIAISSPHVALGYLKRPELTAQRFVASPFGASERLYQTGDLARLRPDGSFEYVGRIDNQIKIRGFRVELAEIEAVLRSHTDVRDAVVMARQYAPGSTRLVAYLVAKQDGVEPINLQSFLSQRLPDYMIPSAFVNLKVMPLTTNGKVDRHSLPEPHWGMLRDGDQSADFSSKQVAPLTQRESEIAAIWQQALGLKNVDVDKSFDALGGDSLSTIVALVHMTRLGIPQDVARGIFQARTIREIARGEGAQPCSPKTLSAEKKANLLINIARGALLALIITDHWFIGTLNKFISASDAERIWQAMSPLFSVECPGFAFIFGVGLGYFYYPKYEREPARTARLIRWGAMLLLGGIFLDTAAVLAADGWNGTDLTFFFTHFYSILLYYLLALLTAPLWFRLIHKSHRRYLACIGLIIANYVIFRICRHFLSDSTQVGIFELARIMLVAKYAYFSLSMGVLAGIMAGFYFKSHYADDLSLRMISAGFLSAGVGGFMFYLEGATFDPLYANVDLWRWAVYIGMILIMSGVISLVLKRFEGLPGIVQSGLQIIAVLGQLIFPIYVAHELVLRGETLLGMGGMPKAVAMAIPFGLFFVGVSWMSARLYRLYYGR